jgi:hypothetical protein
MTDESVQEKDVNSAKEEDSEHSNRPDTLWWNHETTEDEVDESQMSYRGSLIKRRKHQRKRLTIQLLKIQNKTQVMYLI